MGTSIFYVLASSRPEYNSKIRAMFSLAPVAFFGTLRFPLFKFVKSHTSMALTAIPVYISHFFSGTSEKTLAHYSQNIASEEFQLFDYKYGGNLMKYGMTKPPKYNLSLITAPVALHYSQDDLLVHPHLVFSKLGSVPSQVQRGLLMMPWSIYGTTASRTRLPTSRLRDFSHPPSPKALSTLNEVSKTYVPSLLTAPWPRMELEPLGMGSVEDVGKSGRGELSLREVRNETEVTAGRTPVCYNL
uniref:Uncharacterized protein n=1 Tax=Timema bartmani TaxID=61472 RepID=A0A7R9EY14_9NEOP|nr:unnamed protein product [Timema bartmani]